MIWAGKGLYRPWRWVQASRTIWTGILGIWIMVWRRRDVSSTWTCSLLNLWWGVWPEGDQSGTIKSRETPLGQTQPIDCFVNKILLQHGQAPFVDMLSMAAFSLQGQNWEDGDGMICKTWNITIWPLAAKFAMPPLKHGAKAETKAVQLWGFSGFRHSNFRINCVFPHSLTFLLEKLLLL